MEINEQAPVTARGEVAVDAAPEVIWEIMAAVEAWPAWNPDVASATLEGPLAPGTLFRWKAGPGTITSTLREVEPPRRLGWTGRTMGIRAVHVWQIEPRAGGAVVRTEESWEGLVVRLFRGPMQKMLAGAIDAGLRHLKAEAERRAAAQG